jgi:RimJ/RimL family protein N-acetyltransferase
VIELTTDRLHIRNFTTDDTDALHAIILQYSASPFALMDHKWPTEKEEIAEVVKWFASGDRFLAVCLKDTKQLIGFVQMKPEEISGLGFIFNFNYHGKGYATEACRAVLDDAFNNRGVQSVMTGTSAENKPSCRLLLRLGFHITGESRDSFQTDENGNPIEFPSYQFTLTKQTWLSRND